MTIGDSGGVITFKVRGISVVRDGAELPLLPDDATMCTVDWHPLCCCEGLGDRNCTDSERVVLRKDNIFPIGSNLNIK